MLDDRIVSSDGNFEDEQFELSLRPQRFQEYIGQDKVKNELMIYIQAALNRQEALDHVLLYGPPGLGKTTMAQVIANEMNVNFKSTSGPAIERTGDLVALLNELEAGDVLFIDEIHRLPRIVEEMLYSAMEDYFIDIIIGQDAGAHSVHFDLPPFTLIGATTKAGALSAPLRNRFGIISHMEFYSPEDLGNIVKRTAHVLNSTIDSDAALEIASRSRGTPRISNRLFKRVRDFAEFHGNEVIDLEVSQNGLSMLQVDELGLDLVDQRLLSILIENYAGGPVGLNALASNIGEDIETIEDMYEPYLLQVGLLQRTPRGRVATKKAYDHLNYPHPN